jgi:hypothetical protein
MGYTSSDAQFRVGSCSSIAAVTDAQWLTMWRKSSTTSRQVPPDFGSCALLYRLPDHLRLPEEVRVVVTLWGVVC